MNSAINKRYSLAIFTDDKGRVHILKPPHLPTGHEAEGDRAAIVMSEALVAADKFARFYNIKLDSTDPSTGKVDLLSYLERAIDLFKEIKDNLHRDVSEIPDSDSEIEDLFDDDKPRDYTGFLSQTGQACEFKVGGRISFHDDTTPAGVSAGEILHVVQPGDPLPPRSILGDEVAEKVADYPNPEEFPVGRLIVREFMSEAIYVLHLGRAEDFLTYSSPED